MPPTFPHTLVKSVAFTNYSGVIRNRAVPVYCTPEGGTDASVLRRHGDAVRAILGYVFEQNPPATLRTVGSTWSFSNLIEPGSVVLDPVNFTFVERVPAEFFTQGYQDRSARGFVPLFVEGGTQIGALNRRLGADLGLALQTSGAADGQRVAGALATGTHGAALQVGALHDTVLGLYLVVAPNQAVFVQSGSAQFASSEIAPWLEEQTGIPTRHEADDTLFRAALVALGSLGVVFGVVLEATPLYRLKFKSLARPHDDASVWQAIRTLDTSPLHPETVLHPYHFNVTMHPYPERGALGLVATLMWKVPPGGIAFDSPRPGIPRASTDLMSFIGGLTQALGGPVAAPLEHALLARMISEQLHLHDGTGDGFPGHMFGPTSLPPGAGASTELVVDHVDSERALELVFRVLGESASRGDFLLGAVGVRFVPQTQAFLGMNVNAMNTYIELPSIRNDGVLRVYEALWDGFEQAGIPFTCHWGQLGGMNETRLRRYFGGRVDAWRSARARLLDPVGQRVFEAALLRDVGLAS
ncbi:MAG TPA: hypothetical protein VLJ38_17900 [Polyangiaceae bacterium]|nr:hypothetical protein [Polyangiaceae bacterium]